MIALHSNSPLMKIASLTRRFLAAAIIALTATATLSAADKDTKHDSPVTNFTWGAEVGGGIDLTSNDMSTANIAAFFGYRNQWIDLLGVGAEIDIMVNDSNRAFPIYAAFRSNFRNKPSVCFLDLRAGVVFNNMGSHANQTRFFASPGLGFNLAGGRTFQSYLIVSYTFNDMQPFTNGRSHIDIHGLHSATLRLGVAF